MTVEGTREAMTKYFNCGHSDVSMMADDVVFTVMATGQEHRSPDGVNDSTHARGDRAANAAGWGMLEFELESRGSIRFADSRPPAR